MDSKIILVISLICFVQISTAKNYVYPSGGRYATDEFLDAFAQKDDFGSSITLSGIESTFQHNNGKLQKCYKQMAEKYHNFGQLFTTEMNELAVGVYYDLENKKKKIAERVKKSFENIANAMTPYPYMLKTFFEENRQEELESLIKQIKNNIEHWDVEIFVELDRFIKEVPNAQAKKKAEEAKQRYQEIRENAKSETKKFTRIFQLCVMPRGD